MPCELVIPRQVVDAVREKLRGAGLFTPDMENSGWQSICIQQTLSIECSDLLAAKWEIMAFRKNHYDSVISAKYSRDMYAEMGHVMETIHTEMETCLVMYKSMLLCAANMKQTGDDVRVRLADSVIVGAGSRYAAFRLAWDYYKERHASYRVDYIDQHQVAPAADESMERRFNLIEGALRMFCECSLLVETPAILNGVSAPLAARPRSIWDRR